MASEKSTAYLVLWWMGGGNDCPTCGHKRDPPAPYAAAFDNEAAAEAAANVRNALLVKVSGRDIRVEDVVDWYRRDDSGRPMPAEWRDITGQCRAPPWMGLPKGGGASP